MQKENLTTLESMKRDDNVTNSSSVSDSVPESLNVPVVYNSATSQQTNGNRACVQP